MKLSGTFKNLGWFLLVLVTGCGQTMTNRAPWPATVHFKNLGSEESAAISTSLKKLSGKVGTDMFFFDDSKNQFQITITVMNSESSGNSKAGLATYDQEFCNVEINDLVFTESYKSYFEPVLWHEIGHCSGLSHDKNSGEIMYYLASPEDEYTEEAFKNFFSNLLHSTLLSLN